MQFQYNEFNQVVADYQQHAGMVDMAGTPSVQYQYDTAANGWASHGASQRLTTACSRAAAPSAKAGRGRHGQLVAVRAGRHGRGLGLGETRTHNAANEITAIAATTGSAWPAPAYDLAGNTTILPQPAAPAEAYACVYDAWNRLVRVSNATSGETLAEYQYDGRNFRTVKCTYAGGELSEVRHSTTAASGRCWKSASVPRSPRTPGRWPLRPSTCGACVTSTT